MKNAITTALKTLGYPVYMAGEAPQDTTGQWLTLQRITSQDPHHLDGVSSQREETYQIDAYGDTEADASNLGDAARDLLDGASYAIGAEWAAVENVLDDVTPPIGGGESPQHRTTLTLRVWYQKGG